MDCKDKVDFNSVYFCDRMRRKEITTLGKLLLIRSFYFRLDVLYLIVPSWEASVANQSSLV